MIDTFADYSKPSRQFSVAVPSGARVRFDGIGIADIKQVAGQLAASAVQKMKSRKLFNCAGNVGSFESCTDEFMKSWGLRLHRRPLKEAEYRIYREMHELGLM